MRPANAVNHKLIDLLRTTFEESAIVLTVVVCLILGTISFCLLAFTHFNICILTFVVIFVQSGQQTDHTFEQEQDVVETMNLKLFEKGPSKVLLVSILLYKSASLIDSLKVFNHTDLLAIVDLFVILEQFGNNFLKYALLLGVLRLGDKGICISFFLLHLTFIVLKRLVVEDFFKDLEFILLFSGTIALVLPGIYSDRCFSCRQNILCLAQKVQ